MLIELTIRNFTIVDHLELSLKAGMTVLTGETGAGKSILFDALNLALGGRADASTVRHGSERSEITASFDIKSLRLVSQWLQENELDDQGECLIRRTVNKDGRSKGFINGQTVPMQTLRQLGEMLLDIHGQHAHQALLKRDMQRASLDDYALNDALLTEVKSRYQSLKSLTEQYAKLLSNKEERESRIELLSYQLQELEDAQLYESELSAIEDEHAKLANINQIAETGNKVVHQITEAEHDSINAQLNTILRDLEALHTIDAAIHPSLNLISEAQIQIQEAATELRAYLSNADSDPGRLQWVEDRIALYHDLARKHHIPANQLTELQQSISEELTQLKDQKDQSENLDAQIEAARESYFEAANRLTSSRQKAAQSLSTLVTENMHRLSMESGIFRISVERSEQISASGNDKVEFLVSTNSGHPPRPMQKVASGGELSRISLAIQVITAGTGQIPTLIFDEVDVGIGGGTAEIVGLLLRKLSNKRQVLCVTHQPQVAALAHQHLRVIKHSSKNKTNTDVIPLNTEQRTDEIARMLGGLEITDQTLSHASEMIQRSQKVDQLPD